MALHFPVFFGELLFCLHHGNIWGSRSPVRRLEFFFLWWISSRFPQGTGPRIS
ncbi:hypothetical protein CCACVL1_07062 [Corchorus capsularis]|uniref:Uncharacterized protein n=1 Tax=Corchorus capsularis TaxID=210143 RepID=A0A1R3J9X4_COCAP|nr:hypothetical protein CCACVL1_07062 [Corchorus capsularis]